MPDPLTPEARDELRGLAAETRVTEPGDWSPAVVSGSVTQMANPSARQVQSRNASWVVLGGGVCRTTLTVRAWCKYIAAADPPTVLALLDERDRLAARVAELEAALVRMNAVSLHQTNRVGEPVEIMGRMHRFGVHPLTCGNDSRHATLFPFWTGERVVLRCPDCDYEQGNTGPVGG